MDMIPLVKKSTKWFLTSETWPSYGDPWSDFTGTVWIVTLIDGSKIAIDVYAGRFQLTIEHLLCQSIRHTLELVCMDFLTLEQSKGGYQHVLIIADHFSRFSVAVPTNNFTAKTTAEAFYNNFITNYCISVRIYSDRGANFGGNIITKVCNITGMKKSKNHPLPSHG